MRFLLHPPGLRLTASSLRQVSEKVEVMGSSKTAIDNRKPQQYDVSSTPADHDTGNHVRTWGQQCAPYCGCVVRFESKIDGARNIVESSYQAKTVVATSNGHGRLEPMYTSRNGRPMFKECSCKTIHHLAKEVTRFLPGKSVDKIRNMTDFSTPRSSPAFRHSVLAANGLPRTDTHCFDLLEEAFTAMIKGHMVKPRTKSETFDKSLIRALFEELPANNRSEHDGLGTRQNSGTYGSDRSKLSLSSPRSMSALRMLDINAEAWEYEQHLNQINSPEPARQPSPTHDWVSYVDELHRLEESA